MDMTQTESIRDGFNYDEAITMAELCRRVYQVFSEGLLDVDRARELYKALYYDDDWQFVHALCDYKTDGRCLIVKRKGRNQYALAFRGTIVTGEGVDLTNILSDEDITLAVYDAIPKEKLPPPRSARVHLGFLRAYQAFELDLHFFFNVLHQSRLEQRLLRELVAADLDERQSRIGAIGAAIAAQYGQPGDVQTVQSVSRVVRQITDGELDVTSVSLDGLISRAVRCHRVLAELAGEVDPDSLGELAEPLQVYVTGHSLGGALATLCALDLKRFWSARPDLPPVPLKCYTVGSPFVGNAEFADYFNRQMAGFSFRVQNYFDPVVHWPTRLEVLRKVPFPYNMLLLMPGTNFVRAGDDFYDWFTHVGEAYTLLGLGSQTMTLDFGGPLRFAIPIPFPHGPDGYKSMLLEAQVRETRLLRPVQRLMGSLLGEEQAHLTEIERQVLAVRRAIGRLEANQKGLGTEPVQRGEGAVVEKVVP